MPSASPSAYRLVRFSIAAKGAPSVFDRSRTPLYKEASYKPYIIAAMIFLAKVKDPQATLKALEERGIARWFQK